MKRNINTTILNINSEHVYKIINKVMENCKQYKSFLSVADWNYLLITIYPPVMLSQISGRIERETGRGLKISMTCPFYFTFVCRELVRFCFTRLIQRELDQVRTVWNQHRVRRQNMPEGGPAGKPSILFDHPYLFVNKILFT